MSDSRNSSADPGAALQRILHDARENRLREAAAGCDLLLVEQPGHAQAWNVASHLRQRLRDFDGMLAAAARAAALRPDDPAQQLRHVECLFYCGRTAQAIDRLGELEGRLWHDPQRLVEIGGFYTQCNLHERAHRCYERAVLLAPSDRTACASLAASFTTLGNLQEAEEILERLVNAMPTDPDAWVNLANLREWTPGRNHVSAIEAALSQRADPAGEAPLCYALFKELEDLGEPERAFAYLQRGAAARRRGMRYRVERDIAAIEAIISTFTPAVMQGSAATATGAEAIFVMGLPRTGTTLVDRIISSHPQVESLGELRDLTFAVMRLAGPGEPGQVPLIERSAGIDFPALGKAYLEAVAPYRSGALRFVDKTPGNSLYAGLVHLALPGARLVLLRRHPLDACYAMYRTLFQAGYPFSYDLEDLGRYYVAWHRLVEHWRSAMPGILLEVEYERLVADQEHETRRLLEHCGLEWDPRCLEFHRNPAPAATASATQVRRPVYRSSVGRWERHASALEPLARILREAGILQQD
jgi:tetratricopeptide (TPR) repeat protein